MAAYFDPTSWSPLRAVEIGRRLFEQSWPEQWFAASTAWVDPVLDLGSGTVTALLPDVLMTMLSEGILSRFGGQDIAVTVIGHELRATLRVLKVRRRGAHFQAETVLSELHWDTRRFETVTAVAHGVRLVPGVPTKVRVAGIDLIGALTVAELASWIDALDLDWRMEVREDGSLLARHRTRKLTALVEGQITDDRLTLRVERAWWRGIRLPRRMTVDPPGVLLSDLPRGLRIAHAAREGDLVRFRLELPATTASFDLAQIRDAVVAGTTLIIF
ncbi:hypothetical protein [Nocardia shimofusensis]|uniref:hypothetical protein n=1 Tax=Nocardia shimofusensis TaxID=228596 RepID=UPI000830295E|nr:hypothetical protein [Nocardia shimofusensis]